jgi:hypothetical protein
LLLLLLLLRARLPLNHVPDIFYGNRWFELGFVFCLVCSPEFGGMTGKIGWSGGGKEGREGKSWKQRMERRKDGFGYGWIWLVGRWMG